MAARRVIFSFDQRSHKNLTEATAVGNFTSMAQTTREAISLLREVQNMQQQGFDELIMRRSSDGVEIRISTQVFGG